MISQTVFAGQLDMLGVVALATLLFVLALFGARTLKHGLRQQLRPAAVLGVAIAFGAGLSAPLLLPGLQLARMSVHTASVNPTC